MAIPQYSEIYFFSAHTASVSSMSYYGEKCNTAKSFGAEYKVLEHDNVNYKLWPNSLTLLIKFYCNIVTPPSFLCYLYKSSDQCSRVMLFSIRHCIDTEPKVLNLCFFAEKTCQTLGKNINLS